MATGKTRIAAIPAYGEGSINDLAANIRGELIACPLFLQLALEGRVFHTSNAARETALAAGGTSFSDTAPAFNLDVPTGTTMIPIKFILNQGGTVAGGPITVLVCSDSGIRYSSSGTALTIRNARDDVPRTAKVTGYSNPTIGANTLDVSWWSSILDNDVATIPGSPGTQVNWPYPDDAPPILVGPASLTIYTYAASTQPSWFFSFKWAELDSSTVM